MSNTVNGESRMYINGQLVHAKSGKMFDNVDPATEEVIGQVADGGRADVEDAIAAARRAFDETEWSRDHAFRKKCLEQLRDGLREVAPELRKQVVHEVGAPMGITENGPQGDGPIEIIDYYAKFLDNFNWERDIGVSENMGIKSHRYVWKEAIGVVAAISPWNFPLQINLAKVAPALAAGCSVVLKPAPQTPFTATILGKVAAEYTDIPAGVFNVVTSSHPSEMGEILTTDPRIDAVSFTGSTGVGRRIMAAASATVKRVFLELGGKSAFIVLDDADFNMALLTTFAVCFHAGQGCALPTRFLLPKSRYEEGVEIVKMYMSSIPYGNPFSGEMMGPLISKQQQERVLSYIEKGKQEGARLIMGGGIPAHLKKGYYVEPTLFADVNNSMTIAQEEIFGPVLCLIPYEDDEDAIRIANDSIYGLSGGIYSASEERAMTMARRIRTGTLNINGGNFFAPDSPFGGYKQSGIGREMGHEGFEEYLQTKTVAVGGR